jgi:hypothetical protein
MALTHVQQKIDGPAPAPIRDSLLVQIQAKRALILRHNTILLRVIQQLDVSKERNITGISF